MVYWLRLNWLTDETENGSYEYKLFASIRNLIKPLSDIADKRVVWVLFHYLEIICYFFSEWKHHPYSCVYLYSKQVCICIKRVFGNWTNPLKVQSVSTRCRSHIVSIIPADVPATKALGHLQVWCWLRFELLLELRTPHGGQKWVILSVWFNFRKPSFYIQTNLCSIQIWMESTFTGADVSIVYTLFPLHLQLQCW